MNLWRGVQQFAATVKDRPLAGAALLHPLQACKQATAHCKAGIRVRIGNLSMHCLPQYLFAFELV